MHRTTLMNSLFGTVALLASAGAGCGEWQAIIDKARDYGAGPKTGTTDGTGTGTGAGGMTGGAPNACTQITEGGDTSCKDSGTWKMYGSSTCEQRKMVLTDLKFGVSCAPDRYQTATYFCCPAPTGTGGSGPAPDPIKCDVITDASGQQCKTCWDATGMVVASDCAPSSTGGSSGGETCTKITDGGPSSCKDAGTWKMYGAARCAQQNLTLTDVVPQTLCAGGIESVTYVCCGSAPTGSGGSGGSTDPIKCGVSTDASGQQCKTCWDATGMVVANDCAPSPTGTGGSGGPTPDPIKCDVTTNASGQQCKTCWDATGVVVANDCAPSPTGAGGSGGSTGGGSCINVIDGGPSSCKDYATWKKYGTDRCAQQKLVLTDVLTLTTCAGGIESVAYVCCAP